MKARSGLILIFVLCALCFFTGCPNGSLAPPPPGKPWVTFNKHNSPLRSNNVNNVFISTEGDTWMGTDSGAFQFRDGEWTFYRDSLQYWVFQSGLPPMQVASVRAISEGKDGSIWFGTNGGGLVRLDNFSQVGVWQRFTTPYQIQNDIVTALSCQFVQEGDVWVASYYGASRYIPDHTIQGAGTWEQYTNSDIGAIPGAPSLSTVAVNPIDTKTWFGTYSDGLISFDYTDNSWLAVPPPGGVADPQVNAFAFDFSGVIWVAMNSAIGEFDPSHTHWVNIFTAQNTDGLFPITGANSIATDRNSLHYFATTRGVLKLADTTWTILNSSNSPLPSDHINSVALDLRGNLWIGTDSGCAVYNPSGTQLK